MSLTWNQEHVCNFHMWKPITNLVWVNFKYQFLTKSLSNKFQKMKLFNCIILSPLAASRELKGCWYLKAEQILHQSELKRQRKCGIERSSNWKSVNVNVWTWWSRVKLFYKPEYRFHGFKFTSSPPVITGVTNLTTAAFILTLTGR